MASSLHPAITVSNIRNYIPITLDAENGQYTSWVELFKIHCRAFEVYDHIIPPSTPSSSKPKDKDQESSTDPDVLWLRLDAIVLQWIYGTISKDLLITILAPNTTAAAAWKALEHIFIDSKPTRAIHLKQRFANIKLDNFSSMNVYCQEVKSIADQLANVDAPVDNQSLVLQLISGLSDQYDSIATLLQQSTPLPDFYTTRSKLCMKNLENLPSLLPPHFTYPPLNPPIPSHLLTLAIPTQGVFTNPLDLRDGDPLTPPIVDEERAGADVAVDVAVAAGTTRVLTMLHHPTPHTLHHPGLHHRCRINPLGTRRPYPIPSRHRANPNYALPPIKAYLAPAPHWLTQHPNVHILPRTSNKPCTLCL